MSKNFSMSNQINIMNRLRKIAAPPSNHVYKRSFQSNIDSQPLVYSLENNYEIQIKIIDEILSLARKKSPFSHLPMISTHQSPAT